MKLQRILVILTLANLGLLAFLLTRVRADNPGALPVLRGSAWRSSTSTARSGHSFASSRPTPSTSCPTATPIQRPFSCG